MARISTIQTNFTAGELSPKAGGRVDIARYQNSAERLRNVLVNIYGGAERTPGTEMVKPVKYEDDRTRLVPFVFSRDISYVLEFGDAYMRVFRARAGQIISGGVPYEIATPYGIDEVWQFRFAQRDDTMFITHPDFPIYILQRIAETNWRLAPAPLSVLPFAETGRIMSASATLSSASTGSGRTLTAASGVFMTSDVGRRVTSGPGVATITGYTSTTVVTVEITGAFTSTSLASGAWTLEDSPQAPLKPSDKGTVGQTINLVIQDTVTPGTPQPSKSLATLTWASGTATATVNAHGYSNGDTVRIASCTPAGYNGDFTIGGVTTNTFTYPLAVNPGAVTVLGTAQKIPHSTTSSNTAFRGDEVGQYIRINRGLVLVTQVVNSTTVRGIVRMDLDSDVEAPASAWTLEQSVWSSAHGYPSAVTINQQRLVVGGTRRNPNGVWGSRTGLYYDFTLGDEDTDAFFYALDGESNGIQHLASIRLLLALTMGTEWTLVGGVEKPLTPTNVQAKDQSVYGASGVRPARIGDELVFLQRAGRRVLAMSYSVESDSYKSPDLTILSEHLTRAGVVDMAYQQEPVSVLWCVCADGTMATLTIDRNEGVIAWTGQDTQGAFESICSVPAGDYDEVWTVVRREVNGQVRRYVERFTSEATTHSAVFGTDPAGATTWAGLDHLEGMQVVALADGTMQGEFTVSGGQITLARTAKAVQIGLRVVPEIKLLRPEIGTQFGSAQASKMRAHQFMLLVLDTIGATVNDKPVSFQRFGGNLLDRPPEPYTGWKGVGALGWREGEMDCTITQPDPLPFHVLAVVRKWTTND